MGRHELDESDAAESGPRLPAAVNPASAVHKSTRSTLEAELASTLETLDQDVMVAGLLDIGDRPTPVEPPPASLVNATAAGLGSSAMPITIPPTPAVEVAARSSEPGPVAPVAAPSVNVHETDAVEPVAAKKPAQSPPATPNPSALKTRLARKFTELADEVNDCFADFRVGPGVWQLELTAPDGMSTGGGKQALQHLRLRPTVPGYAAIVVGVVNPIEKSAELRDYAHLEGIYELRFNRRLELTSEEWERVLQSCEVAMKLACIRTERTPPGRDLLPRRHPGATVRYLLAVGALLTAAFVAWRVAVALFS